MSILGYKRPTIFLGACCILLLILSVCLFVGYVPLKMRLVLASDQVRGFEEVRERALQSSPVGAASSLEEVVSYYPSGTKQETGSLLDRMVESARTQCVREIVAYLRSKTGEDLGSSPEPWIKKYVNH